MSSGDGEVGCAVGPSSVFVVVTAGSEAAVEVADEAVAEGSECLVVEVARSASLVVELSGSWAGQKRAEGPLVDGVVEAFVADVAGEHCPFGA